MQVALIDLHLLVIRLICSMKILLIHGILIGLIYGGVDCMTQWVNLKTILIYFEGRTEQNRNSLVAQDRFFNYNGIELNVKMIQLDLQGGLIMNHTGPARIQVNKLVQPIRFRQCQWVRG